MPQDADPDHSETDWQVLAEQARVVGIRVHCGYETALILVSLDTLQRTMREMAEELSRLSSDGEDDGWRP